MAFSFISSAQSQKSSQRAEQEFYLRERQRLSNLPRSPTLFEDPNEDRWSDALSESETPKLPFSHHKWSPVGSRERVYSDDSMPFRIASKRMTDRRNALGRASERKSLMQGILSVAGGGEKPPSSELKQGKHLPEYLGQRDPIYEFPECAHKPLKEPDEYYLKKTYIMVNKQGSIFRFSKAKSLFLFEPTSKIRSAATDLYIRPMFAHFIMFVIICNCACMIPAEPVSWIEDYLEYVFTFIYIVEAMIKIITRGFVLHQFSYLRDPWNWLDFTVIMSEIITSSLKAILSKKEVGGGQQVAMLRAFRVLRALKTMSVIPDLRAIVKALLHSIRALKDAILLTVFVVSVFALIGYQLFHGTLRQKCMRIPGTLDLAPDAMYLDAAVPNFGSLETPEALFAGFRTLAEFGSNSSAFPDTNFVPIYATARALERDWACSKRLQFPVADRSDWSLADATFMTELTNAANATHFNGSGWTAEDNASAVLNYSQCFTPGETQLAVSPLASLLWISGIAQAHRNASDSINVTATYRVAAIPCLAKAAYYSNMNLSLIDSVNNSSKLDFNSTNPDLDYVQSTLLYWDRHLRMFAFRRYVILFRIMTSRGAESSDYVYLSELSEDSLSGEERRDWCEDNATYCLSEPATGNFYYPGSPNRPNPEPVYCAIEENDICPLGYKCMIGGGNPDFGYTSFDHFFLSFLTSFRLVALDAWGRLYYLTLHTIGKTYAIFYVVVVLLGSYYLVNLILAVVYMSYEEQHAAVEVEELEAKEREENELEDAREDDLVSIHCDNDDIGSSESDVERARGRVGLITTSLTSYDTRVSGGETTGGPFSFRDSRRRRWLASRRSRATSTRSSVFEEDDGGWERRTTAGSIRYKGSVRRNKNMSTLDPGSAQPSSDCCSDDCHDRTPNTKRKRKRRSRAWKKREHHTSGNSKNSSLTRLSTEGLESERTKLTEVRSGSPTIQLVVTAADNETPEKLPQAAGGQAANCCNNFLTIEQPLWNAPGIASMSSDSFSDYSCRFCDSQATSFSNGRCSCTGLTGSHNSSNLQVPIFFEERRLSETSSLDEGQQVSHQVVEAEVNHLATSEVDVFARRTPVATVTNCSANLLLPPPSCNERGTEGDHHSAPNSPLFLPNNKYNGSAATPLLTPLPSPALTESVVSSPRSRLYKRKSSLSKERIRIIQLQQIDDQICDEDDEITPVPTIEKIRKKKVVRKKTARRVRHFCDIFLDYFALWSCCPSRWKDFQRVVENIVLNPFTDLFITLCIALNTLFMCLERHPMEIGFELMLERANLFFTIVFTVEMVLKIVGLTPFHYLAERWNVFDAVVVFFSCLELLLKSMNGLSVLRAFRLMRILKLAKQWPVLNKLLRTIGKTIGKLWHLTIVFMLVLFIFALIGMQLLRQSYINHYGSNQPRWNFTDFPHAVMVVFRIQCGEWVENMFNCLNVAEPGICIPLFILVYVIGNLVILNLFLALLLNSFSGDALQTTEIGGNSISEAFNYFASWGRKRRKQISNMTTNVCQPFCCRLLMGVRGSPKKIIDSLPTMVEMRNLENANKIKPKTTDEDVANESRENQPMLPSDKTAAMTNGVAAQDNNNDIPLKEHHHRHRGRRHHRHRHRHHHHHHNSNHNQEQQPGHNQEKLPEQNQEQQPGHNQEQQQGHNQEQQPGHNQKQQPEQNQEQQPGHNQEQQQGHNQEQQQGHNQEQQPGHNQEQQPEQNQEQQPGHNQKQQPEQNQEQQPGHNQEQQQGHNQEQQPGHNQEQQPEQNQEQQPGHNQKQQPEQNQEQQPGHNQEQQPGHNQEQLPEQNQEQLPKQNQEKSPTTRHGTELPSKTNGVCLKSKTVDSSLKVPTVDGKIDGKKEDGNRPTVSWERSNSESEVVVRVKRQSVTRKTSAPATHSERQVAENGIADDTGEKRTQGKRGWQKLRTAILNNPEKMQEMKNDIIEPKEEENDPEETEELKTKKMEICLSCFPNEPLTTGYWATFRGTAHKIVVHRHFDNLVIFCILLSSATLALEDVYLHTRPTMQRVVQAIDIFCCVFFTLEMLVKWAGYGFKFYFTNAWCCLDFVIVLISILNQALGSNKDVDLSALRVLRTFRALRPLRALSRFEGMKIVVDALIRAVPSIGHVFMVCVMFWLIFSILGVNLFAGRFGRCVSLPTGDILPRRWPDDPNNTLPSLTQQCSPNNTQLLRYLGGEITSVDVNPAIVLPSVTNRTECDNCARWLNSTAIDWQVPSVNFDSVMRGYLVLMQVATFNGWLEIMESAIDITGKEQQPSYEHSFFNYAYFCVFIVFGAFFSLNLFIGVIIDNFNQQKIKSQVDISTESVVENGNADGVFLTEEQRRYYNAMKRMTSKTPKKPIPRPQSRIANKLYDVVTSRKFEIGVMTVIMLNLVVMAVEHHTMSKEMAQLLQYFNLGFITLFVIEATLKLIGLRFYYFTVPWNVFDFFVVVISLIATGLNDVMSQYFVQPTLFRIIRLFRVTRILRLIREAKGIRTLLFALMMSLPALFNIGCLLFLFMFIYAIIGMSQFADVQKIAGIDDMLNFETFPNAFLVLFQVSTSEGWDRFIEPILRDRPPYCQEHPPDGGRSNCGNATIGVIYFVTYVMITFLIVVNMYIAIILENFVVATRESAEPLTADDFEQFFEVWQRYDDRLSQYVTFEQLKHLLHHLDFPLRVAIPNNAFIASSHMRITRDGRVHCLEVIIALIKKVLGDSPELNNMKDAMLESFMLKCRTKENLDEETMDAGDFAILLRATITLQRAFRAKIRGVNQSDEDWTSEQDAEADDMSSHSSDCDDSGSEEQSGDERSHGSRGAEHSSSQTSCSS